MDQILDAFLYGEMQVPRIAYWASWLVFIICITVHLILIKNWIKNKRLIKKKKV